MVKNLPRKEKEKILRKDEKRMKRKTQKRPYIIKQMHKPNRTTSTHSITIHKVNYTIE